MTMFVRTGLMPPVTKDGYRRKLTLAKQLGFNYASAAAPFASSAASAKTLPAAQVRPHSQVLTPEYVALADELGLLVSLELPAALYGNVRSRSVWSRYAPSR